MDTKGVLKKVENKVENIVSGATGAVTGALDSRSNSLTVRLDTESLALVDKLVRAEIAPDRAKAVALLVKEGIKARSDLFERIEDGFDRIQVVQQELRSLGNVVATDTAEASAE